MACGVCYGFCSYMLPRSFPACSHVMRAVAFCITYSRQASAASGPKCKKNIAGNAFDIIANEKMCQEKHLTKITDTQTCHEKLLTKFIDTKMCQKSWRKIRADVAIDTPTDNTI